MAIAEVLRRRLGGSALAALTTFALLSGLSAQSTDPNHPAPLGPGVNRGNVDNSEKGHTFYFYAGPGHIDVDMAFEEMGLFGAPLRQTRIAKTISSTTNAASPSRDPVNRRQNV